MSGGVTLVTGMGGELGTRVAALLEQRPVSGEVVGVDLDPPRRRLHRAEFVRVDPRDRRRVVDAVREIAPTTLVHLGIYEPGARTSPGAAAECTATGSIAALGAAAEAGNLERIVARSGFEVYGRPRGAPTRPDESVAPKPTTAFGRSLEHAERVALEAGAAADVPVALLRFAPLVGPHFPSPLGRYLRLRAAGFSALSDLPFSLLHQEDAASAILAAVERDVDGPVNVTGSGAVTAFQALRLGGRIPIPVVGPGWLIARAAAEIAGAPVPDHVWELLVRGRVADGSRAAELLGTAPAHGTSEVVKQLYDWASVTYLDVEAA